MNIRKSLALIVACVASLAAFAKTNYVDKSFADYTGHDGSTPALALRTIQEAVTAATSGDTILVAPGEYGADQGVHENDQRGKSRVYVPSGKNLRIVASGGAAVTAIVGAHDTTTTSGFGDNAVRCVDVESDNNFVNSIVFEGFTFRDGATKETDLWDGACGAVLATVISTNTGLIDPRCGSFSYGAYLVDCTISNCIGAKIQLTVGCTHIRCRIQDNAFVKRSGKNIQVDGVARYHNCLVTRNRTVDATTGATTTDSAYVYNESRFVNCSFVDNQARYYNWGSGTRMCQYYNCIDAVSVVSYNDGSAGNRFCQTNDTTTTQFMMAPSFGDYRLRAGCAAVTAGDGSYVTNKTISTRTPHFTIDYAKDLDGNTIATEGAIALGCCQKPATPAAGVVVGSDKYVEFGPRTEEQYAATWVWPTAYPTNYTVSVRTNTESRIYSYLLNADGITAYADLASHIVFPTDYKNDTLTFRPHPTDASTIAYKRATPSDSNCKLIYLDAETAEPDASQTGSADHPYRTLQQAAARVGYNKYAVFVAAPGDYDDGEMYTSVNGYNIRGRLALDDRGARVVAAEGPATTSIVGAPDSDTLKTSDKGCGPNALGIVALKRSDMAIQGFTLRDAYSGTGTYALNGVCYSYEPYRLVISESILTNCIGKAGATGAARFFRTRISGNTGIDGFFPTDVELISCIVDDTKLVNSGYYFPSYPSYKGFTYGLTMVADSQNYVFFNWTQCTFYNSIFAGGSKVGSSTMTETFAGCVLSGFASKPWTTGVTYTDDPMLLATSGKDANFRVFTGSAAEGAATYGVDNLTGPQRQYANLDYTGKVRAASVAGAFDEVCNEGVYVASGDGVKVVGGKIGYNELTLGESVTLGYASGSTRPLAGYVVDGVTNLPTSASDVITLTAEAGQGHYATPVYSNDWYVDADDGNDTTGLGYNPTCAFKTLKKAMENANLTTGDRVMAMPGTYAEETMAYGENVIPCRVAVKAGITLKSVEGAATTFIKGAKSNVLDELSGQTYDGLGRNAIKCVYLPGGATIDGFTLTNGYTRACTDEGKVKHGDYDYAGGGVWGDGLVRNCVLTGCAAYRGGAGFASTFVDCVFDGNTAIYNGGGSSEAYHYGCLFRNNVRFGGSTDSRGPFWWKALENCTVLDSAGGPSSMTVAFRNDLILGPLGTMGDVSKVTSANFVNCAVVSGQGGYQDTYAPCKSAILAGTGCILTNAVNLTVDDDGRPVIGSNVAIDAGDASLNASYVGDADLTGVQRIYNGAMDIGALEADWRATYAKDLNRKPLVTVTSATANVVETADKKVSIADGASLALTADTTKDFLDLAFAVTDGTLTVTVDGVATSYTAGASVRLPQTADLTDLTLAYAGTGNATILSLKARHGLILFFR